MGKQSRRKNAARTAHLLEQGIVVVDDPKPPTPKRSGKNLPPKCKPIRVKNVQVMNPPFPRTRDRLDYVR